MLEESNVDSNIHQIRQKMILTKKFSFTRKLFKLHENVGPIRESSIGCSDNPPVNASISSTSS